MTQGRLSYIIPGFILLASGFIAAWSAYVVEDNHERSTFEDSPNYIPVINTLVGVMAVIVFLTNLFRALGCTKSSGWCDSGLGCTKFVIMIGLGVTLFIQVAMLSPDERDGYKDNMRRYYDLTIGQCCYFIGYVFLVIFQYICKCCHCCSDCVGDDDEYDLESGQTIYA